MTNSSWNTGSDNSEEEKGRKVRGNQLPSPFYFGNNLFPTGDYLCNYILYIRKSLPFMYVPDSALTQKQWFDRVTFK